MTSLFYCLLTHFEPYERSQAEVDENYPPFEEVADSKHLPKMEYQNAVMRVLTCRDSLSSLELTWSTRIAMGPFGFTRSYLWKAIARFPRTVRALPST